MVSTLSFFQRATKGTHDLAIKFIAKKPEHVRNCEGWASGTGPNSGRFGTLGRNTFRGPAYYNFDFALIKTTPIGHRESGLERVDLQFRAEFFNLFNVVNMGLPANTIKGSGFGVISKTAGTSRQIQFSLKLIY